MPDFSFTSIGEIRATVDDYLSKNFGIGPKDIPKEGSDDLPSFVRKLWEESRDWRKTSLQGRFSDGTREWQDPVEFFRECRRIEAGDHWKVWGERKKNDDSDWIHQLTDNEPQDQIRARRAYLLGNWHDVMFMPNINDLNRILDQERKRTKWGETINRATWRALTEGTAFFRTILDVNAYPAPSFREIVVDSASIFPTPFSISLDESDGCWFLCVATLQNQQILKRKYPKLKNKSFGEVKYGFENINEISLRTDSTQGDHGPWSSLVPVYELYLDDWTLEARPYDQEETDLEHIAIHKGQDVSPHVDENHEEHIKAHVAWIETINKAQPIEKRTLEDNKLIRAYTEVAGIHIQEHMALVNEEAARLGSDAKKAPKKRFKYPNGRYIVMVDDQIVEDTPNKLAVPWRKLWNKWDAEKMDGHFWGRGMIEVLWHTAKTLDTMLSRIADMGISVSMPQPWLHVNDKKLIEEQELNNDPTQPKYYQTSEPRWPRGLAPQEPLQIYQLTKEGAKTKLGVNEVTFGESPTKQASGELAQTLLRQNITLITGEANQNLTSVVEDMIEARLMLWKKFYTHPRGYILHGVPKVVTLSNMLSKMPVRNEKGEIEEIEIPFFEVNVKPNSNFPNQWEVDLEIAMKLAQIQRPDGSPLLVPDVILDIVAERYPELGRTGKYYNLGRALELGMIALEQEQKKKEAEARILSKATSQFTQQGLNAVTKGNENGPAQEG